MCGGTLKKWCDLGRQPVSQSFRAPDSTTEEFFFDLAVGLCTSCTLVQHVAEVPRELMFRDNYPYRSSESAFMRRHFEQVASDLLATELSGPDPFAVEIGCNDGIMLRTINEAGVRHLGVDPSLQAAEVARATGIRVLADFFEEATALAVRQEHGPADLIYSANTISHIPYLDSVFRGVAALLAPNGVFVFEDRYLGDILDNAYFDQIYDEHFYLLTVRSVQAVAARLGLELVHAERIPVHGGSIRYTVALPGARVPSPAVAELVAAERDRGLDRAEQLETLSTRIEEIRTDLVRLLRDLRANGKRVVGYGATAKSATVTNYCGIDQSLVEFVCDSTKGKHGLLTPGMHLPVRPIEAFSDPYPDYALLFAWNHAAEIMAKEQAFREQGGRWILYVPKVHVV
ncbi:class I SAM-dependent methyltransferase [Lentzea sp. PSKA42]|uniref:Class I SAM-dependent methyltransferase n=1 Tax=Lentzea indica TaxID=2604800 RepID=A0ABX1FV71_9PSEU|nr:class I SAM-dependent methyltransferase [Lentzea indica]